MNDNRPKELPDPYATEVMQPDFRLNVNVKQEEIFTIKSVAPSRGTIQHLIAGYVNSLAAELRAKDLASYSPENYAAFVEIVERRNKWTVSGTPIARPLGTAPDHNVRSTKKGVRSNTKNSKS